MPPKKSTTASSSKPGQNKRKREAPNDTAARPAKRTTTTARKSLKHESQKDVTTTQKASRAPALSTVPKRKLQVYVFGTGSGGELGLGPTGGSEVKAPRPNPNLAGVVSVSTGGMHAAALTANGKALTWGVNDQGTLARDSTWDGGLVDADKSESDSDDEPELNPKESAPDEIPSNTYPAGTLFTQVAAGDSSTFCLTSEGDVYGCGTFRDHNGVYGFTLDTKSREIVLLQRTLMRIPRLKNIVQIRTGSDFALALDKSGVVYAWGCGQQNELGHRLLERRRQQALLPAPVGLPKKTKIVSIHAGANHAFAIDSEGDTWAWGLNNFGQTGVGAGAGDSASTVSPQKVPALIGKKMVMIDGGLHHSIGMDEAGQCLVWGRLDGGQSGLDLSKLPRDDPERVVLDIRDRPRILVQPTALPLPKVVCVAAGSDHCLAVTEEGKGYSWGFNATYQCGQGNDDDIMEAKLMTGKWIREEKLVWAGAGGQYSMLASALKEN